jgi:PAS domain S-box-containing protein
MENKPKLSQTMRIDLIPDIPAAPAGGDKHPTIAQATRKHKRIRFPSQQGAAAPDAHYNELLQSLYDAAVIADQAGAIIDANLRALEFLLYDRTEIANLTIFDIVSGADENLIHTLGENLQDERFTLIQAYCIRKDGTYFPAEIAVNELDLGEKRLCFFIRDITLRRQSEEMLRTEHTAIQNAGNGIAIADLNAALEYVNPAMCALWGYSDTPEMLGMSVCDLLSDAQAASEALNGVMQSQQSWTGEMIGHRKDGAEFNVQVSATCNRNAEGETVGLVLSFLDVSDKKKVEDALREAERHRVMLESLGAACHHLGQPATVLLANLGIMQRKVGGADEDLKDILNSSVEAAEMLGDILHRLNTVNEYKTTRYLDKADGDADSVENRILDI